MKVYDYDRAQYHCREGVATEERPGVFLDTFWGAGERHHLTQVERASMRDRFDTDDFEELDGSKFDQHGRWITYAPDDRQTIPSQHGLQVRYFIRLGASPDLPTQIETARQKVAEAEHQVASAASSLQWAREELAALEARADA